MSKSRCIGHFCFGKTSFRSLQAGALRAPRNNLTTVRKRTFPEAGNYSSSTLFRVLFAVPQERDNSCLRTTLSGCSHGQPQSKSKSMNKDLDFLSYWILFLSSNDAVQVHNIAEFLSNLSPELF